MKKCPFCKSDIEDNARFCLYCMKPLNQKEVILPPQTKKPRWFLVVIGICIVMLLTVLFLAFRNPAKPSNEATGGESSARIESTTSPNEETTRDTENDDMPQEDTPSVPEPTEITAPQTPNDNPPDTVTTPPTTPPAEPTEDPTQEPSEPVPTEEPTEPEIPVSSVIYTYRSAKAGDEYNAHYQNNGNDIVITGVAQQSPDGIYDIPSHIDGKRVIAIVANAFSDTNATVVYIPDTMLSIWNYAFAGCNLTDVYFRGEAIHVESYAFFGSFTLHCSATCNDRNFRYYKDSASIYGATWQEWNR